MARIDIKPNGFMVPCSIFGCNTPAKISVGNAAHMYDRTMLCPECAASMKQAFDGFNPEELPVADTRTILEQMLPEPTVPQTEPAPEVIEAEVEPETPEPPAIDPEVPLDKSNYESLSRQDLIALAVKREIPGAGPTRKSADLISALREQDDAQ